MAYGFNGTTSKLDFAGGNGDIVFGPITVAALINSTDAPTNANIIWEPGEWGFSERSGGELNIWNGSADGTDTTVLNEGEWVVVAVTKASGTAAPRFHLNRVGTPGWVHRNSASSIANSSTPTGTIGVGYNRTSANDFWFGSMVCVGTKNVVWTDLEIEANLSLTLWQTWVDAGFSWLVGFETLASVEDKTGGGGNETGRTAITLVSDSAGWVWTLRPPPIVHDYTKLPKTVMMGRP